MCHTTRSHSCSEIIKYLLNPSKNQIALQPIEEYKVIQVIYRLKNKSSKGIDGISNNLIKTAKYVFAKPLTLIINQMLYRYPRMNDRINVIIIIKECNKVGSHFKSGKPPKIVNLRSLTVIL